jgi:hypothetical protein
MNTQILAGVALFCAAGISSATSPCPDEAKNHCGPNPFYALVVSLADECARIDQDHAADYKAQLKKFVAEHPSAYAALDANPQFAKELGETKQKFRSASRKELYGECTKFRTKS